MSDIQPYTLSIPEEALSNLSEKLSTASFPDELDGAGWDYGAPLADIKRLTVYWKEKFSWRDAERKINELPNYKTTIEVDGFDPLSIHFVHQKSKNDAAIPLLFVHGWPGHFLEVSKLLPLLAVSDSTSPAFHVVAPSLPNYGFSQGVRQKGFGIAQYAETCHKLMQKLGYPEYVTQGGDWGSYITRAIGKLYPAACRASHLNMIVSGPPSFTKNPLLATEMVVRHITATFSAQEKAGLKRTQAWQKDGLGYLQLQTTKPQTIGYALADSPVALLAWIYEKLHDWTDGYPWTEDEVLTWVGIYWFSEAGPAASGRIYYEAAHVGEFRITGEQTWTPDVKLGLAYFPKELVRLPKAWGQLIGPVVFVSEHESGGHFAAWERPEFIVGDLRAMFGKEGGAYKVIKGKDGFS